MSPDKRARKPRAKKPVKTVEVRLPALDRGPPYLVRWHPLADAERDASWPAPEHVAIAHAAEKLEAEGMRLGAPTLQRAPGRAGQGTAGAAAARGQEPLTPNLNQVTPDTFIILAVGPEAQIDRPGFDAAVARAQRRLAQSDLS